MTDEEFKKFKKLPQKVQDFWDKKKEQEFIDNILTITDIEIAIGNTYCRIFYSVENFHSIESTDRDIVGYGVFMAYFSNDDIKIFDDSLSIEALEYLSDYHMHIKGQ
jgi:hypothetical protein